MFKRSLFFSFILVGLIASCQKEASDLDQASNIRGGNCLLKKGTDSFLCLDYLSDADANTASVNCDTEYARYNTSHTLNAKSWTSGSNNTCATSTNSTQVGKCTRTDAVIRYYSAHFSTGSSQSDCQTIHSGTWSAP